MFNPRKVRVGRMLERALRIVHPLVRHILPTHVANGNTHKVLIYEASFLGDFVMATPAFRLIRHVLPDAEIACLCPRGFAGMQAFFPWLDRLIAFDPPWSRPSDIGLLQGLQRAATLIAKLRSDNYDLAIDLRGDLRNIAVLYLSGASRRIAFAVTGGDHLLTDIVPFDDELYAHQLEGNIVVASHAMGIQPDSVDPRPSIFIPSDWQAKAEEWLASRNVNTFMGIQPSASSSIKIWPHERWVAILNSLTERGWNLVLFGSPSDREGIERLRGELIHPLRAHCAPVEMGLFFALLQRSSGLICHDSFAGHAASALNVRVLTIHGPRHPDLARPYTPLGEAVFLEDVPCRHDCHGNKCSQSRPFCILDLPLSKVQGAVDRHLSAIAAGKDDSSAIPDPLFLRDGPHG